MVDGNMDLDAWEQAYLSLNRDYVALELARNDWRQKYWDAVAAKREWCDKWYDSEKNRLHTLETLEGAVSIIRAAATQFPNDDGWLDAAQGFLADKQLRRHCVWVQEQDYPVYYAGCKENDEFHLAPGMDLYPYCHWCGGLIEIGSAPIKETAK